MEPIIWSGRREELCTKEKLIKEELKLILLLIFKKIIKGKIVNICIFLILKLILKILNFNICRGALIQFFFFPVQISLSLSMSLRDQVIN